MPRYRVHGMPAAVLISAVALAGAGARAAALPGGGLSAAEVAQAMQEKGYKARVEKDGEGDPVIRSASQGLRFSIYFYGCRKTPRCESLEFQLGMHLDKPLGSDQINRWNRSERFGRAYVDTDNDPVVEMDVEATHGMTTEGLAANIDTWDDVVAAFPKFLDCAGKPADDACQKSYR